MSLPAVPADLAEEAATLEKSIASYQIDEVLNAIAHLERSNAELRSFLKEAGPDPALSQAIYDNVAAIAIKAELVAELRASSSSSQLGVVL